MEEKIPYVSHQLGPLREGILWLEQMNQCAANYMALSTLKCHFHSQKC